MDPLQQHVLVWEFRVRPGCEPQFEADYGPEGRWAQLFRRAEGFVGTELLRDLNQKGRYITIDRWRSAESFERFRERYGAEYAALDSLCEAWTQQESRLGTCNLVSPHPSETASR